MSAAQQILSCWKNDSPKKYAMKLLGTFGKPDYFTPDSLTWVNPYQNVSKLCIMDEELMNMIPSRHYTYVYSTARLATTPAQACMLQYFGGSIIIDQLKKEVTARCDSLGKNQVTLGFVYDYVTGHLHGSKDQLQAEYKRRIDNNIATRSGVFPLPMSEM
jgi:hypothetical protein